MYNKQALPPNSILNGKNYQYCIEKVLGQGSFGITYLAKIKLLGSLGNLQTNVTVAVKEFFMQDFNSRSGFTYYYAFENGSFNLLEKLSEEEIEERNMWT